MRRWFYLLVILQLIFLLAQAGRSELDLKRGQVVVLKTEPVDPRSLFMGNYMNLGYEISQLDLAKVKHDARLEDPDFGGDVYVVLKPGKPYAQLVRVTVSPPKHEPLPYLRGDVMYTEGKFVRIEYGLERYFIPETKQDEVNRLAAWRQTRPPEIAVEVAVVRQGRGLIKRVLVDGKPLGF